MISTFKKTKEITISLFSAICVVLPDSCFGIIGWISESTIKEMSILSNLDIKTINILISRLLLLIVLYFVVKFTYSYYINSIKGITLYGENYEVSIEYGDLFQQEGCKRIINFDECFTTTIGETPDKIQATSVCGQYLALYPNLDMKKLINESKTKTARTKSEFEHKDRYESGTIVPNGDDLLLAFAKLDYRGRGKLTRKEYIECLFKTWEEIDLHKGEKDVCIPILGSGVTYFESSSGTPISQQELLDIMLMTYQLSPYKVKTPQTLRIICRERQGFELKNVDLNFRDYTTQLRLGKLFNVDDDKKE